MSKILLLNHHGLGEVLMSLPACRWLVKEKGEENIWMTIVGPEEQICREQRCGTNFIPFSSSLKAPLTLARLLIKLRRLHFDSVIALYGFQPKIVRNFSKIIGVEHWYCQYVDENDLFDRNTTHKRFRYLKDIQHFLGKKIPDGQELDFFLDNIEQFEKYSLDISQYIVLVPGSGEMERFKRWPIDQFVSFAELFLKRFPSMKIIVTGTVAEIPLGEKIMKKNPKKIKNLCGKLNLSQLASIFNNSKLVIGGDCGGLHLAKAAGARIVAIMGPTNSALTGPIEPELIIDKQLPGTPWYCRKTLKEKAYLTEEPSMQIPAIDVMKEVLKHGLL